MRAEIFLFLVLNHLFSNILLWKNTEIFLLFREEATHRKSFKFQATLIAGSALKFLVDSFQEMSVKS